MQKSSRVYVIAEIGINHCGELKYAFQLVDCAVQAGADAVKFQTFRTEELVRQDAPKMPYQLFNDTEAQNQFDMLKKVEFGKAQHMELVQYCRDKSIDFISTPYDKKSADLLVELGADAIKIASTDTTNIPFLRHVADLGLPIIYSTGVSAMWEIVKAVNDGFINFDKSLLTILHCVSNYPAPIDELNLKVIGQIKRTFNCRIGFSDHSNSLLTGAYAVCAGATAIEKHITFDRNAPGPDHRASFDPDEFADYVNKIREAEIMLGDGIKQVQLSEKLIKKHMQKSLVMAKEAKTGTRLTPELIATMRPAEGISPLFFDDVVGAKLIRDKAKQEMIKWGDLQID